MPWVEEDMNIRAVIEVLDRALLKVAESEFTRLTKGSDNSDVWGELVDDGLKSLDRLRDGRPPKYNEDWTALLYLTWYQPKQINLAYSLIKKLLSLRNGDKFILSNSGRIHVVDFGCGALAMQFAVAFAAADALEQGQSIDEVRIDSIDNSQAMISLGEKLWKQFKIEVCEESSLYNLVDACCLIEPQTSGARFDRRISDEDNWLTAIHAVYHSNYIDVKRYLSQICNAINPDVSFITTFDAAPYNQLAGRDLIEAVNPFNIEQCQVESKWISPQINGTLPRVTQWRQHLRDQIPSRILERRVGNSTVRYYLSSTVDCLWRPETCLIYDRSSTLRVVDDVDDLHF